MPKREQASYDQRFLESFAGKSIFSDPIVAIIELIANSWDAGATQVSISWPLINENRFSIIDNGHGMTTQQFRKRFETLAYDRAKKQGSYAEVPDAHKELIGKRPVFGRNGKGRLSGFAFGSFFQVKSWREGKECHFKIERSTSNSLSFQLLREDNKKGHGTEVFIENSFGSNVSLEEIKKEVGMRFITDPNFEVVINDEKVTFLDIPEENVEIIQADVPSIGSIKITVIDIQTSDKTTHQHGVAWHVKKRLVGECTWKGTGNGHLIDGRNKAAKRYIFIVNADCLEDATLPD